MDHEIHDDLDELPAPPRVDIPDADLVLLERAARAIGAVGVEVVDGEGYVNLHFADGSVVHSWNPLMFSGDAFELLTWLMQHLAFDHVELIGGASKQIAMRQPDEDAASIFRRAITSAAAEIEK